MIAEQVIINHTYQKICKNRKSGIELFVVVSPKPQVGPIKHEMLLLKEGIKIASSLSFHWRKMQFNVAKHKKPTHLKYGLTFTHTHAHKH
jgi:hypothetical protein